MAKWIWFDLDDTLYDFKASSLSALHGIYVKYGFEQYFRDENEWVDLYHHHNTRLWELYNRAEITQQQLRFDRFYLPMKDAGVPDDLNRSLNDALDSDYLKMLGATGMLLPGALEAVSHLKKRGYYIGILSNGFKGVQHDKLKSSGLDKYVDLMILSDDININKPDRRIYDYALRQSNCAPEDATMIGDNPATDIAGAINAGWNAILFAPGYENDTTTISDSKIPVLHSLSELLKW